MANIKETWVFSPLFKKWYFHILSLYVEKGWMNCRHVFKEQMDDQVGLGGAVLQEECRKEIPHLLRYTKNSSLMLRDNWGSYRHRRGEPEVPVGNLWRNEVNTQKYTSRCLQQEYSVFIKTLNGSWVKPSGWMQKNKYSLFSVILY